MGKRRLRNAKIKFLKPGVLAQHRDSRASGSKSCSVAVINEKQMVEADSEPHQHKTTDQRPPILSPVRFQFAPALGASDLVSRNNLTNTPTTPRVQEFESQSRLESLSIRLLVRILDHLHHDQLRAVFHVSKKIRQAVIKARESHVNYTSPDGSRQEMLNSITPDPTEYRPSMREGGGDEGMLISSPLTPKAPKRGPRPPSRLTSEDMRQVTTVLFQDSTFSLVPSVTQKPICKALASNKSPVL